MAHRWHAGSQRCGSESVTFQELGKNEWKRLRKNREEVKWLSCADSHERMGFLEVKEPRKAGLFWNLVQAALEWGNFKCLHHFSLSDPSLSHQGPIKPLKVFIRLCKSTLVPVNGPVFQAVCKRTSGCQNYCLLKKEKVGPFLMCDEGNAWECPLRRWVVIFPLWNNLGLSFLEGLRLLAEATIWESRCSWKATLTGLPRMHVCRLVFISVLQLLLAYLDSV